MMVVSSATHVRPFFTGKPSASMVRSCLLEMNLNTNQVAFVGDRMDTDVRCALESGVDSVLVLSGVSTPNETFGSKWAFLPTIVLEHVGKIVPTG